MDGAWITCPVEVKRLEQKISGAIRRPERGCGEVEGMKEYIERELLLIGVDGCISSLHAQAKGEPIQESAIKLVEVTRDYIASFTAADVAPVVHGKWEPGNPICPVCGENKFKDLDADVWADWQPKFCPNCGTRMDKEVET